MTENNKNTNKKRKILISLILALIILVSFWGGFWVSCLTRSNKTTSQILDFIDSVGYIIDPETGEAREFTEDDYIKAITNGLLDDYSVYYSPEEFEEMKNQSEGSYDGLGFLTYSNSLQIYRVIGNSPCDIAGVPAGQPIKGAKVQGGNRVSFSSVEQLNAFFEEHKDEQNFSLYVGNATYNGLEYKVTKAKYEASYVTAYDNKTKYCFRTGTNGKLQLVSNTDLKMIELADDTAYIKLDLFEGGAAKQFGQMLKHVLDQGKTKIILDLIDNGGGQLDIMIEIASHLIYNDGNRRSAIVCTEEKTGNKTYYTPRNNFDQRLKHITVLANHNTASASECLIGAMIYYGDCFSRVRDDLVLVGNRTYGKGIMQTTYLLDNGGAFTITTGKLYWPDEKTCIHGKGIKVYDTVVSSKDAAISKAVEILAKK